MPQCAGEPHSAPPAPQDEAICPWPYTRLWPRGPGRAKPESSDANSSCTETLASCGCLGTARTRVQLRADRVEVSQGQAGTGNAGQDLFQALNFHCGRGCSWSGLQGSSIIEP